MRMGVSSYFVCRGNGSREIGGCILLGHAYSWQFLMSSRVSEGKLNGLV